MFIRLLSAMVAVALVAPTSVQAEDVRGVSATSTSTLTLEDSSSTRLGVKLGLNASKLRASGDGESESGSGTGFVGGIGFEIPVGSSISIEPELLYVQKGAGEDGININLDYLEVPLLVKAKFGSDLVKANVFAGPYIALAVTQNVSIEGAEESMSISENVNDIDFGIHMGAGVDVAVAPNVSVFLDGRYMLGLANQLNTGSSSELEDGATLKNRGFLFLSGVRVGL